MAKISIVIPVLNARPRISETLESIRQQTYPRDEIETIIVDDGSSEQCVRIARTFLRRHGMQGTVLVTGGNYGSSASLNRGWQAASGDWIQFLDGDDLLAPSKLDVQIRQLAQLPDVICSSWQRLGRHGDGWQLFGPATGPELAQPVLLELVSPQAGLLGPALFRKKSLEAVAGFSDGVVYPDGEHLMLKLWGMGGKFVAAPSPSPLFFVRQDRDAKARAPNPALALQHLQNMVIAEAMLRQQKLGIITRPERKRIARLCDRSLSELYESDWAAFQQYWQWLREIDPNFLPRHSGKLKLASLLLGYESAQGLAHVYRWIKSRPARAIAWLSSISDRGRDYVLGDDPGASTGGRPRAVAAALVLLVGVVSLAALVASGQLGEAARPAHPPLSAPLAETQRPGENLASAAVLPVQAAKVERRGEISPTRPEPKVASVVAPERPLSTSASVAAAPSPVEAPATKSGLAVTAEPPRAELDRSSPEAVAQVASAAAIAAPPTAPEVPHSRASLSADEAALPTKRDASSTDAGPPVAPAQAKLVPLVAPDSSRISTTPAIAPPLPPVESAKVDGIGREAAPPVATVGAKTALAITREITSPSAGPTTTESASRVPAAGADRGGGIAAPATPRAPVLSPQEREAAEKMVERGERDLADGNVASARQFFLRAATTGLARGALLLAATYDPQELARLGVVGLQPSPAEARKWYERAHELGAPEARERLARLAGG
jgi:glycosyltransferase involved in cell wall biosynthesis